MKRLLFIFLLALPALCVSSQKANIHINVTGNAVVDRVWYVSAYPLYGDTPPVERDSVVRVGNSLDYNLCKDTLCSVMIYPREAMKKGTDGSVYISLSRTIMLVASRNMNVDVNAEQRGKRIFYHVNGDGFNADYANMVSGYRDRCGDAISEVADQYNMVDSADTVKQNALMVQMDSLSRQAMDYYRSYVRNNPDKDCAAFLLLDEDDSIFIKGYEALSQSVKTGLMKPALDLKLKDIAVQKQSADNQKRICAGASAPDFTLTDLSGRKVSLSSLRGKYVVLDFWGTWCYWCMKGVPDMKTYYDRYRGKVEFVGIDCNDKEPAWRKVVTEKKMNWTQLRNATDIKDDVAVKYGVEGYPTKVIIDGNGKIVEVFAGEDETFYQKLDSLFK
jgi:thiol-disulfide isomerase/thioredoxin